MKATNVDEYIDEFIDAFYNDEDFIFKNGYFHLIILMIGLSLGIIKMHIYSFFKKIIKTTKK